jgi:hypothetical protein
MIELQPAPQVAADPYVFHMAYARCFAVPETAMDKRHVFMLYDVLRSFPFEQALEIGCFNGASSSAFVQAINEGAPFRATFCDVAVTHSLMAVVGNCRNPDQVRITSQPSWMVLDTNEPFDFVLVDAAHDTESVSLEIKHLLRRKPLCVMAHDTSATEHGYSKCEGAELLKKTFTAHPEYHVVEDAIKRPGERTERGLFLATTSKRLRLLASDLFRQRQ